MNQIEIGQRWKKRDINEYRSRYTHTERGFSHARVKKASPPRGHCRWARGAHVRRRAERSCGAFTLVPRGPGGNSCGHTSVQSFSPSQETVPSAVSGEGGLCAPLGGRGSSGAFVSLRSSAPPGAQGMRRVRSTEPLPPALAAAESPGRMGAAPPPPVIGKLRLRKILSSAPETEEMPAASLWSTIPPLDPPGWKYNKTK